MKFDQMYLWNKAHFLHVMKLIIPMEKLLGARQETPWISSLVAPLSHGNLRSTDLRLGEM